MCSTRPRNNEAKTIIAQPDARSRVTSLGRPIARRRSGGADVSMKRGAARRAPARRSTAPASAGTVLLVLVAESDKSGDRQSRELGRCLGSHVGVTAVG